MNTYTYEEIAIGQKESFTAALTAEQMEQFRQITGDDNPLHIGVAVIESTPGGGGHLSARRGYSDRVVYGMLTASFLSTVAGMYLPGMHSLIHEVELKFVKPLLLCNADHLTITAVVTEKNDTFERIVVKVRIDDSSGTEVLRGKMKIGVSK